MLFVSFDILNVTLFLHLLHSFLFDLLFVCVCVCVCICFVRFDSILFWFEVWVMAVNLSACRVVCVRAFEHNWLNRLGLSYCHWSRPLFKRIWTQLQAIQSAFSNFYHVAIAHTYLVKWLSIRELYTCFKSIIEFTIENETPAKIASYFLYDRLTLPRSKSFEFSMQWTHQDLPLLFYAIHSYI